MRPAYVPVEAKFTSASTTYRPPRWPRAALAVGVVLIAAAVFLAATAVWPVGTAPGCGAACVTTYGPPPTDGTMP